MNSEEFHKLFGGGFRPTTRQVISGGMVVSLVFGAMTSAFQSQKNCPPQGWCVITDATVQEEQPHTPEENGGTSPNRHR
jgi:hypothetical protein